MQRGGSISLRDILDQAAETAPAPSVEVRPTGAEAAEPFPEGQEALPPLDDLSPLPGPGTPYRAHARASNKPLPSLVFLLADATARGFAFSNLDTLDLLAAGPGQGLEIVLRFAGLAAVEVRIGGRRLEALYNYLGQHRVGWIRQLAKQRDFLSDDVTVITGITIEKLEG